MSWKVEIRVSPSPVLNALFEPAESGQWTGNSMRFATREEAENWMNFTERRLVESDDPVNCRWNNPRGLEFLDEESEKVLTEPIKRRLAVAYPELTPALYFFDKK